MKRGFLVFLFVLFSVISVGKEKVTIYSNSNFFPFSYEDKNGEPKGLYVDVANAAFSKMKDFDVVLEPVPWNRGKSYMKSGKGFALLGTFYHGHDWDYIYPYSLAYYTQTGTTVFLKSKVGRPRPNIPEDYIGLKGGNPSGFDGWVPKAMKKAIEEGKVKYEEAQSMEQNIAKLVSGRVDFIFAEKLAFSYALAKLNREGKIKQSIEDFSFEGLISRDNVYLGYSKYNNASYQLKFQQDFDNAIFNMLRSGEIDKIFADFRE